MNHLQRTLSLILALVVLVSLTACEPQGQYDNVDTPEVTTTEAPDTTSEITTEAATTMPEVTTTEPTTTEATTTTEETTTVATTTEATTTKATTVTTTEATVAVEDISGGMGLDLGDDDIVQLRHRSRRTNRTGGGGGGDITLDVTVSGYDLVVALDTHRGCFVLVGQASGVF